MYWKYLKYLLRHKWFVMIECFKVGLVWRGLKHDLSKFRPCEFIPYAKFFYGDHSPKRDSTGYYKPTDTGDKAFDFAWLLHQKINDHHWQWWVLPEDDGGTKLLEMSENAMLEMVCDWVGAGKAQGFQSLSDDIYKETRIWYNKNKSKIQLNPNTRSAIERIINVS